MQGIVFTVLSDMLIEKFGMSFLNEVLDELDLKSGGAYTAGVQYDDEEVTQIVVKLSEKLSLSVDEILKIYGEYLFPRLLERLPNSSVDTSSLFNFLSQVDSVIHKEVRRIHPDVYLPTFECERLGESQLKMRYFSKRKLCSLSEGLILGAAVHFGSNITIHQTCCLKLGDDYCELVIDKE